MVTCPCQTNQGFETNLPNIKIMTMQENLAMIAMENYTSRCMQYVAVQIDNHIRLFRGALKRALMNETHKNECRV